MLMVTKLNQTANNNFKLMKQLELRKIYLLVTPILLHQVSFNYSYINEMNYIKNITDI